MMYVMSRLATSSMTFEWRRHIIVWPCARTGSLGDKLIVLEIMKTTLYIPMILKMLNHTQSQSQQSKTCLQYFSLLQGEQTGPDMDPNHWYWSNIWGIRKGKFYWKLMFCLFVTHILDDYKVQLTCPSSCSMSQNQVEPIGPFRTTMVLAVRSPLSNKSQYYNTIQCPNRPMFGLYIMQAMGHGGASW